jgi:hypothetical protein
LLFTGFVWKFALAAACIGFFVMAGIAYRQSEEVDTLKAKLEAERLAKLDFDDEGEAGASQSPSSPVAATLVNVTTCRWDPTHSTADVESGIVRPGQSLSLLEGVAEISTILPSGAVGRFQLEGPLEMMLTSRGMPHLQYGKLAAEVSGDFDRFTFQTPLGRASISQETSIGLFVSVNEVELHVFSGQASFEMLGPTSEERTEESMTIAAGTSLRLSGDAAGNLSVARGAAEVQRFVTQVSMESSQLKITDDYVSEIRQAKPIGYWRFENDGGRIIRNEMGNHLALRVYGDGVRSRRYEQNRAAEFDPARRFGYLMSDDRIDGLITGDYSVELWFKPSHRHQGVQFVLFDEPPKASDPANTGLLMEIRGPSDSWYTRKVGNVRFLHRSPPGLTGGASLKPSVTYAVRSWQHMVGLKQGDELRFYLNGQLIDRKQDPTKLANNMRILMGQLYPHQRSGMVAVRPYFGELDEVALYDRALGEEEVLQHYQLARPTTEPSANRAPPDS